MLMYRRVAPLGTQPVRFPPDDMVPLYIREELRRAEEALEAKRVEEEQIANRLHLVVIWEGVEHKVITNKLLTYAELIDQLWV